MIIKTNIILIVSLLFIASNKVVIAEEPNWANYQRVLNHVKQGIKNGVSLAQVDYQTIKNNNSLDRAYQDISTFNLDRLSSRDETLAFYINTYNILAIKKVLDHWPTNSIKDSGNFFNPVWDKSAGRLGGKTVTLNDIEHKILRPMGEPRIHFAIVCASVSCPDLRPEPYTAKLINTQLDDQTKQFLFNKDKGLRVENDYIRISKIFDWFEDDFDSVGGVQKFLRTYRHTLPHLNIKPNIPYNWSTNGLK